MSRISFILFVATIVISPTARGQQVNLSIGQVNASPGSQVVVPVSIAQSGDISSLQFTLQFDSEVLELSQTAYFKGRALVDHAVALGRNEDRVTFVIFSPSLSAFQTGEDDLISVIFELDDNVPESLCPLK